jgi:hypothetical protein
MSYDDATSAARKYLTERDWNGAYRYFGKAHGLGHDILRLHVAAHRGMLLAGWRAGNPGRVVKQLFLIVAAYLFESRSEAKPAAGSAS